MVTIRKKTVTGKDYYYLEHSIREGSTIKKKQFYLGTEIPKNIEILKKEFINEFYQKKWYTILDNIKKGFSKELMLTPKSTKDKELNSFMIKFTYDTQKIEGSKLTLRETANLLEKGITPKEKPLRDVKEAETHKEVFYNMLNYNKDLSLNIILLWHKNLFSQTKKDMAGKIRTHGVAISGSKFVPPSPVELNPLLEVFLKWYHKSKNKIHPVELAALVHLTFVTIHPFGDGNGRISRLLLNFILHKYGYPMLDIPYENRNSYYISLERAQTKNNDHIFIQWFIKKYIKENRRYIQKA